METTSSPSGPTDAQLLANLRSRIRSSEAYLDTARGTDRRAELRHLANLRRIRDRLLQTLASEPLEVA